jgi:hypothetical protein
MKRTTISKFSNLQISKFAGIFALIIVSISCSVLKIARPPETYQTDIVHQPASFLSMPFNVDMSKIERMVNQQFKGLIYSDTSFDDNDHDNLMVKAWKMGNVKLVMDGNQLIYQVPLSVWIKKKFVIGAFGLSVTDTKEATGNIMLKFRTHISILKDWSIAATTSSDGFEWITTPVIQLGAGMNIPLPVISDLLLNANLNSINTRIDNAFKTSFDLKSMIAPLWKSIQEPVKIPGDYPLWLKVIPLEISTVPLNASSNLVNHTLGIKAYTELYYGEEPPYKINDSIPGLKLTSRLDNDFNISLVAGVPFTLINEIANEKLKGYQFSEGKYKFEVNNVFLYGNADNLIVAIDITGSVKGTIFVSGKPYYDKETSMLKVRDLDYDIRTKNVLVRSASWILHHDLLKTLGRQLSFPIGDQLESAQKELQSYLDKNSKFQYFTIGGTINKPEIGDIIITQKAVKAMVIFKGQLHVSVETD